MIRMANPEDVPRMLAIYAPYVTDTSVTMEYEVPSQEAFLRRFERIMRRFPWLVWEEEGLVQGYAYADIALERAAYQWDADMSIYLAEPAQGRGIGHRLYDVLECVLSRMGYRNLYALVTGENVHSCRFHESRGYERLGTLKRSGFKQGRWYDVYWYGLLMGGDEAPSGAPLAFDAAMLDLLF